MGNKTTAKGQKQIRYAAKVEMLDMRSSDVKLV